MDLDPTKTFFLLFMTPRFCCSVLAMTFGKRSRPTPVGVVDDSKAPQVCDKGDLSNFSGIWPSVDNKTSGAPTPKLVDVGIKKQHTQTCINTRKLYLNAEIWETCCLVGMTNTPPPLLYI
jgi:hypothetical protein